MRVRTRVRRETRLIEDDRAPLERRMAAMLNVAYPLPAHVRLVEATDNGWTTVELSDGQADGVTVWLNHPGDDL